MIDPWTVSWRIFAKALFRLSRPVRPPVQLFEGMDFEGWWRLGRRNVRKGQGDASKIWAIAYTRLDLTRFWPLSNF